MVNWVLTKGLQNLLSQINAAFPNRDHTSDGTIGDYAHTQEKSGHNPDDTSAHNAEWDGDSDNVPEVRAIDVDSDLKDISMAALVAHIVSLKPSSVLRYVIYDRVIYEAGNNWNGRPYTGASPHTEHAHFSGAYSDSSDENTTYNYRLGDIPVALTAADKQWITDTIADIADQVWETKVGNADYPKRTVLQALNDLSVVRDAIADPKIGSKNVTPGTPLDKALDIIESAS